MEVYPKFIVESDELIIGKCTFHKELAENKDNVKGGGWFNYDHSKKTFTFFGESHDFGKAEIEDIKEAIENDKVYANSMRSRKLTDHKFIYYTGTECIKLN